MAKAKVKNNPVEPVENKDALVEELLRVPSKVTIGGTVFKIKKWKVRKSLIYSATVMDIFKEVIQGFKDLSFPKSIMDAGKKSLDGKDIGFNLNLSELIKYFTDGLKGIEFTQIIAKNVDPILDILMGTLEDCDGVDEALAKKVVDDMDIGELILVMKEIIALNFLSAVQPLLDILPIKVEKGEKK